MTNRRTALIPATAALALCFSAAAAIMPRAAQADSAGAFIGGVMAARVASNMRDRTEAEQEQAYYAQQSAQRPVQQQAAPAPAPRQSAEQRIAELDKLAAGGYISKEEYKAKKQAIIDDL